jgi:peptidoglycan/LPS O-acetylase OafA/YrhL
MQAEQQRIFGLDLLRAMAILLVVIQHGAPVMHFESAEYIHIVNTLDGVDLFFVLSGFLIGNILIRSFRDGITIAKLKTFLVRRWLRTVPLYYFFLVLNLVLSWLEIFPGTINAQAGWYFIFMQNFAHPEYHFYYESWSLTVEEWFYLLFAGGLFTMMLLPRIRIQWAVPAICIAMLACGLISRYINRGVINEEYFWEIMLRKLVLSRMDTIAWGIIAAYIMNFAAGAWKRMILIGPFISAVLFYIAVTNKNNMSPLYHGQLYFIVNALWIMFLLPALHAWKQGPLKRPGFITFTSKISYSMYLMNLPMLYLVMGLYEQPHQTWMHFVLYMALIYVLSFITYTFIEKPFMNMRRAPAPALVKQ